MRSHFWAALVALSALAPSSVAAQNNNYFINPPNSGFEYDMSSNPVYKVGDKIAVSWTMTYTTAVVYLQQATNPDQNYEVLMLDTPKQGVTWTVDVSSFNIKGVNNKMVSASTFWLLVVASDNSDSFSSHYFNVTDPSATKTTMSTSTATSTTSTATITTSHATDTAAGTVTGTPKAADAAGATSTASASKGGMTSAQKTGLGIGIGVGVLAVAAIAGGIFWYLRRKRGISYHPVSVANIDGPRGSMAGGGVFGGNTPFVGAAGAAGAAGFYKSPADFASPKMQASDTKVMYGGAPNDTSALAAHPGETKFRPISELDSTPRPLEPVEMPADELRR